MPLRAKPARCSALVSYSLAAVIFSVQSAFAQNAADVHFLQGMIIHHQQAIDMSSLVASRTQREDIKLIAERIIVSQTDEIKSMKRWLAAHHKPDTMAMQMTMPGMLTREQLDTLASARGAQFDSLFLTGMIQHHSGALKMVADLFATRGSAENATIFRIASDIDSDQRDEIDRMKQLLRPAPCIRQSAPGGARCAAGGAQGAGRELP
jgi:uncharacterized protein (DUF305 family)